jgi:putative inorganic carbon (HCO3(-)) transporter
MILTDFKNFYSRCKAQDFGFYMAAGYLIFSYLRPQVIYPVLDILPWTQLCIIFGLIFCVIKSQLKFQAPHLALIIFSLICLASAYNSYYPDYSLSKVDTIFIWTVEVLFFTNCIRSTIQFRLITIIFFLILFKISLFGARTWVERGFGFRDYGIAGPPGFFANSGELSLLIAMLTVMSITFYIAHKPIRKIYYLLPITCVMTVLAASSRGGQISLLIGILLISLIVGKVKIKNLLIMVLVGGLSFSLIPEKQKERLESSGDDKTSQSRLIYWGAGLEMIQEHPWLGVGFYSFPSYFYDHYSDDLLEPSEWGHRKEAAHNSLIEVASSTGYLGLSCFIWLYWIIFSLNRKTRKILKTSTHESKAWMHTYSIGLDISMVVFFTGSFFMSVAFYPYIYFMLMFSLSMNNAAQNETIEASPATKTN